MNKIKIAENLLILAKSILSAEIPSHIEKWVDEWETDDYPYGKLRTKATWKVEGRAGKQRVSRITVDPKTSRVNAPKATVYGTSAKIGIVGNRAWIVVGNPEQLAVYDGTMQYGTTLFQKDAHYQVYADGLGFKQETDKVSVHKGNNEATINGLLKFTIRELMTYAGLSEEDIKTVEHVKRKDNHMGSIWTVEFKKETNRPDFIIKQEN